MTMKRFINILFGLLAVLLFVECGKEDDNGGNNPQEQEHILSISQTALSFDNQGGDKTVEVTTNRIFSISSNVSWCKASPSSGDGTKNLKQTITISCEPNTDSEKRTGIVTVTSGNKSVSVTVTQDEGKSLRLSQTEFNVSKEAQTVSIEVLSNVNFEVLIDDACKTWISHESTKSLTSKIVTLAIAKNDEYDGREGKIIIRETNGSLSNTVVITQSKNNGLFITTSLYNLDWTNHTLSVEVQANIDFDVVSNDSWITYIETKGLTTSHIVLEVKPNETYEKREGTVLIKQRDGEITGEITIIQDCLYGIFVSDEELTVSSDGGEIGISVEYNVEYDVEISEFCQEWISLIETKGLSNHYHVFRIANNPSYNRREGQIVFRQKEGSLYGVVTIIQEPNQGLIVTTPEYHITNEKQTLDVEIKQNIAFEVQPNVSWIKHIETKGLDISHLILEVDENISQEQRTGTVIVKQQNGSLSETITIKQDGYSVIAETTQYDINPDAQQLDIKIKSNVDYSVVIDDNCKSWISIIETKALKESVVSLSIAKNEGEDRIGYVYIKYDNVSETITINQPASIIVFKDGVFRKFCVANYDMNSDGEVSYDEACRVIRMDISNMGIASIDEIRYFKNLEALICNNNQLKSIDVRKCWRLTQLNCSNNQLETLFVDGCSFHAYAPYKYSYLDCSNNNLTNIAIKSPNELFQLLCNNNSLTSIDLSGCGYLGVLDCSYNHLSSLEIRDYLIDRRYVNNHTENSELNCSNNQLTNLVIGDNTISRLDCSNNRLTNLVIGDSTIGRLDCSNNQLDRIDLGEVSVGGLYCSNNQLRSIILPNDFEGTLDCSKNILESLTLAECYDLKCSDNHITELTVEKCQYITCENNLIHSLDVSSVKSLERLNCRNNPALSTVIADGDVYVDCDESTKVTYLNIVPFEDANFENGCLNQQYPNTIDINNNGVISLTEAKRTKTIDVSGMNISSLGGIECFTYLTSLKCANNQLVSFDLSNNPLLKTLDCSKNQLTLLQLEGNPNVEDINCNENQLSSLTIKDYTSLTRVSCEKNKISSLDISNNNALLELKIGDNPIEQYSNRGNFRLQLFDCHGCGIKALDNLSEYPDLKTLICSQNLLTVLDVSKNASLSYLDCSENSGLSVIYLSETQVVSNLIYDSSITRIVRRDEDGNVITMVQFADESFKEYCIERFDKDNDREISFEEALLVKEISSSSLPDNIFSFEGIQYFKNLSDFTCCNKENIRSIDLSGLTSLFTVACDENPNLTSLNVSGCTSMWHISCFNCQLTNLVLDDCVSLKSINCEKNQLTSLDVSGFSAIENLNCSENKLINLDVRGCSSLSYLNCYDNSLGSIDLSDLTKLYSLNCSDNKLTSLDISQSTLFRTIICSNNQLTTIDVSQLTALYEFNCSNNLITAIDVSSCSSLRTFACKGNKLTTLDVSQLTALHDFDCSNNQLTTFNLSGCSSLRHFYCNDNKLTGIDVSKMTTLYDFDCSNNQLTTLNVKDCSALYALNCSNNLLTSFSAYGLNSLFRMSCSNNQFKELSFLEGGHSLNTLICNDNQLLTSLNVANCRNVMAEVSCVNNPKLAFLYIGKKQTILNLVYDKSVTILKYI